MNNVQLKSLQICEQVIEAKDNKISLINIFSGISTKGFPVIHPKFAVIARVIGDNGRYTEKIEIVSPDNEILASVSGEIEIKGEGGNNFIANFINMKFSSEGGYQINIIVDGNVLSNKNEYFILVKKV